MTIRNVFAVASVFGLLVCGGVFAQTQGPNSGQLPDANQEPNAAMKPHHRQARAEKAKRWSGDLVDAGCMAKASTDLAPSAGERNNPDIAPNSQASPPVAQNPGPQTGAPGTANAGQGQIEHAPIQNSDHNPDMGPAPAVDETTSAQMARQSRIQDEARKCAATSATTSFALVLGNGEIVKFNDQGNSKASDEMKEVAVPSGKRVKAKVTGTMEGSDTVKVASVEVKAKHPSSAAPTPSGR